MRTLLYLLAASAMSCFASWLFNSYLFYSVHWWWSLAFFLLLFIVINAIISRRSGDARSRAETVLGTLLVKTLLLLFAVFLYSLYDKAGLKAFCAHFIVHYILFTVIEIRYLSGLNKNKNKAA